MRVVSQVFESGMQSWESLCEEAAQFATEVGKDRLINISVAAAGGNVFGSYSSGVIVVWYWDHQRAS
jgi:hypothetical protein